MLPYIISPGITITLFVLQFPKAISGKIKISSSAMMPFIILHIFFSIRLCDANKDPNNQ